MEQKCIENSFITHNRAENSKRREKILSGFVIKECEMRGKLLKHFPNFLVQKKGENCEISMKLNGKCLHYKLVQLVFK